MSTQFWNEENPNEFPSEAGASSMFLFTMRRHYNIIFPFTMCRHYNVTFLFPMRRHYNVTFLFPMRRQYTVTFNSFKVFNLLAVFENLLFTMRDVNVLPVWLQHLAVHSIPSYNAQDSRNSSFSRKHSFDKSYRARASGGSSMAIGTIPSTKTLIFESSQEREVMCVSSEPRLRQQEAGGGTPPKADLIDSFFFAAGDKCPEAGTSSSTSNIIVLDISHHLLTAHSGLSLSS
eukprot:gene4292-14402_t